MEDQKEYGMGDLQDTINEIQTLADKIFEIDENLREKYDEGYHLVYCRICNRQMMSDCGGGICHSCKVKEVEYQQKKVIPFPGRTK